MAKTIGGKLLGLLAHRKMTRQDLARALDVSPSTAGRWVKDELVPSLIDGYRIAQFFGVTTDWLADPEVDYPPPPESERARPSGGSVLPAPRHVDPSGDDQSVAGPGTQLPRRVPRKRRG